jgi:predicted Rossmann fold nucleotide-binding protein DprA/Smf involved in DNA uptake
VSDYYSTSVADLPLFKARAENPPTSHAAAAMVKEFMSEQHKKILDALATGPAGASRIAERCGLNSHQVGKRLHELEVMGRITLTGRTVVSASGRGEREWRCV